ncbi:MAG: hypothetical protein AAF654_03585 [Myxococcota bacterium]
MTDSDIALFEDLSFQYLNAQELLFPQLRARLRSQTTKDGPAFLAALKRIKGQAAVTRKRFEELTHIDFEDDADFISFIVRLEAYLFEDGPEPL